MGVAFTPEQTAQCDALIVAAETAIDRYTERAWLVPSPVTREVHRVAGSSLHLRARPVAAVTAVEARGAAVGAPWTALVAGVSYELVDGDRGLVTLATWPSTDVVVDTVSPASYAWARVTYAVPVPLAVPADVGRAATLAVADWMRPRLDPLAAAGASSASVGQGDVAVDYRDPAAPDATLSPAGLPPLAAAILRSYRGLIAA